MDFLASFSKNTQICPASAELFHADGQTDRRTDITQLTVVFGNFAKAPEVGQHFTALDAAHRSLP